MAGQALKASLSECRQEAHMGHGKQQFNSNKGHPWQQVEPVCHLEPDPVAERPDLAYSHLVWLEGYSDRQPLQGWQAPTR